MPSQPRSPTPAPLSALFWSAHDIAALRTTAEDWRDDPFPVCDALRNLVNNAAALEGIAKRSSVHANGFAKIVLLKGKRSSVRLHVWHRSNGRWVPDTMPHGHRWEFASWILTGELRETTFREAAGASGTSDSPTGVCRTADTTSAPTATPRCDPTPVRPHGGHRLHPRPFGAPHRHPGRRRPRRLARAAGPRRFDPTPCTDARACRTITGSGRKRRQGAGVGVRGRGGHPMTVLADHELRAALESGDLVVKDLDPELIRPAAVSLRLGEEAFALVSRQPVDIDDDATYPELVARPLDARGRLVLRPGEVLLARTHERVRPVHQPLRAPRRHVRPRPAGHHRRAGPPGQSRVGGGRTAPC